MYSQIVGGRLPDAPDDWKDPEGPVSFDEFMMGMSMQFCQFSNRNTYPGEESFRETKKRSRAATTAAARRQTCRNQQKKPKTTADTQSNHLKAIVYSAHELILEQVPYRAFDCPRACTFCGVKTYYACKGCQVVSGMSTGGPLPLCCPSIKRQAGSSSNKITK